MLNFNIVILSIKSLFLLHTIIIKLLQIKLYQQDKQKFVEFSTKFFKFVLNNDTSKLTFRFLIFSLIIELVFF